MRFGLWLPDYGLPYLKEHPHFVFIKENIQLA